MKIYRAIFKYNNGESCEYEEWYETASPWYTSKELAEKHLPKLEEFKDYLWNLMSESYYRFNSGDPHIEEVELHDSLQDFKIVSEINDIEFKGFDYIPYDGKCEITRCEFQDIGSSWTIFVTIDDKIIYRIRFEYYFDNKFKIEKESNEYFKYDKDSKLKLDSIVDKLANTISPYYCAFRTSNKKYMDLLDTVEGEDRENVWIDMWEDHLKTVIEVVSKFNISLTDYCSKRYSSFYPDIFRNHNTNPRIDNLLKLAEEFVNIGSKNNK